VNRKGTQLCQLEEKISADFKVEVEHTSASFMSYKGNILWTWKGQNSVSCKCRGHNSATERGRN